MPTERLYFDDPYLQTFTARVVQRGARGDHPAVVLDRSAFYPEGGGQAGDHGMLNDVAVLDTQADEAGDVWHILAAPLNTDTVEGRIDWARRWDLMQQHHGQHLLSAAFEQLYAAATVSVHLGAEICTVDLAAAELTPEQLAAVEDRTNAMIWANVVIDARFVTPEDLQSMSLRKPPHAYERIRIVSAGDFDHSPCGGTHPRRTGEVGSVLLRRWERYKGGARVEFVCGSRAVQDFRAKNSLLAQLAGDLHVNHLELPATIERLRAAEERQRKALEQAELRLIDVDAAALLAQAAKIADVPVVVQTFTDRSLESVRLLARKIADGGGVALLGVRADKAQLVFARAAALPYDMGALLKTAAAIVGGRGGGKPEAAQGGGPDVARLDEALQTALQALNQ